MSARADGGGESAGWFVWLGEAGPLGGSPEHESAPAGSRRRRRQERRPRHEAPTG